MRRGLRSQKEFCGALGIGTPLDAPKPEAPTLDPKETSPRSLNEAYEGPYSEDLPVEVHERAAANGEGPGRRDQDTEW